MDIILFISLLVIFFLGYALCLAASAEKQKSALMIGILVAAAFCMVFVLSHWG